MPEHGTFLRLDLRVETDPTFPAFSTVGGDGIYRGA
jgi:hypothetical protein